MKKLLLLLSIALGVANGGTMFAAADTATPGTAEYYKGQTYGEAFAQLDKLHAVAAELATKIGARKKQGIFYSLNAKTKSLNTVQKNYADLKKKYSDSAKKPKNGTKCVKIESEFKTAIVEKLTALQTAAGALQKQGFGDIIDSKVARTNITAVKEAVIALQKAHIPGADATIDDFAEASRAYITALDAFVTAGNAFRTHQAESREALDQIITDVTTLATKAATDVEEAYKPFNNVFTDYATEKKAVDDALQSIGDAAKTISTKEKTDADDTAADHETVEEAEAILTTAREEARKLDLAIKALTAAKESKEKADAEAAKQERESRKAAKKITAEIEKATKKAVDDLKERTFNDVADLSGILGYDTLRDAVSVENKNVAACIKAAQEAKTAADAEKANEALEAAQKELNKAIQALKDAKAEADLSAAACKAHLQAAAETIKDATATATKAADALEASKIDDKKTKFEAQEKALTDALATLKTVEENQTKTPAATEAEAEDYSRAVNTATAEVTKAAGELTAAIVAADKEVADALLVVAKQDAARALADAEAAKTPADAVVKDLTGDALAPYTALRDKLVAAFQKLGTAKGKVDSVTESEHLATAQAAAQEARKYADKVVAKANAVVELKQKLDEVAAAKAAAQAAQAKADQERAEAEAAKKEREAAEENARKLQEEARKLEEEAAALAAAAKIKDKKERKAQKTAQKAAQQAAAAKKEEAAAATLALAQKATVDEAARRKAAEAQTEAEKLQRQASDANYQTIRAELDAYVKKQSDKEAREVQKRRGLLSPAKQTEYDQLTDAGARKKFLNDHIDVQNQSATKNYTFFNTGNTVKSAGRAGWICGLPATAAMLAKTVNDVATGLQTAAAADATAPALSKGAALKQAVRVVARELGGNPKKHAVTLALLAATVAGGIADVASNAPAA